MCYNKEVWGGKIVHPDSGVHLLLTLRWIRFIDYLQKVTEISYPQSHSIKLRRSYFLRYTARSCFHNFCIQFESTTNTCWSINSNYLHKKYDTHCTECWRFALQHITSCRYSCFNLSLILIIISFGTNLETPTGAHKKVIDWWKATSISSSNR